MAEIQHLPPNPESDETIPQTRPGANSAHQLPGSLQDIQPTPRPEQTVQVPDTVPLDEDDLFLAFRDRNGNVRTINTSKVSGDHPVWKEMEAARAEAAARHQAEDEADMLKKVDAALTPANLSEVVGGWLGDKELQKPTSSEWHPPRALEVDPEEARLLSGQLAGELNNNQTQFRVYAADKTTGERQTAAAIVREGATLDVRTPQIQQGFASGDVMLLVFKLVDGTALQYAYNGQTYVETHGADKPATLDYRGRPKSFKIGARQQLGDQGDSMYSTELSEIVLPSSMLKDLPGYAEPPADDPRVIRTTEPNPFASAATLVRMAEEFPS